MFTADQPDPTVNSNTYLEALYPQSQHQQRPQTHAVSGLAGDMLVDLSLHHFLAYPWREGFLPQQQIAQHLGQILLEPASQRHREALLRPIHEALGQPVAKRLLEQMFMSSAAGQLVVSGQ